MSIQDLQTDLVFKLIQSRRTCYQFLDGKKYPIDEDQLNLCLQAAIFAPNHKLTQPWRFWVLGENSKAKLADIYADNRAAKKAQSDSDCYQSFYDKAIEKFSAIPKVILVGQSQHQDPIVAKEDYAACSCAIQNFQLMAWQQQIGVQWSTGPIINDPRTYELFGIDQKEVQLIGALYLGNIDGTCQPNQNVKRKPIKDITAYLD